MPSVIDVGVDVIFYVELVIIFLPFLLVVDDIEDLTGSILNLRPKFIKHVNQMQIE
jgi:hypothetical protein